MKEIERLYVSIPHLALMLDCSRLTVERIIREMQESGSYPPETFLVRPRRVLFEAIKDYCGKGKK